MIHNTEYVRGLIRKSMDGSLTAQEAALLRVARKIYGKEEWQHLVLEALEELNSEQPPARLEAARPDFAKIVETARRRKRMDTVVAMAAKYGMVAAAMVIVLVGYQLYQRSSTPKGHTAVCVDLPMDMEIPVSEFASTIHYGDSLDIPIAARTSGHIAQFGNIEVSRDETGALVLIETRKATAVDTLGNPSIRFVTGPLQQCEVLLPDGTRIRMNAESELNYPLHATTPEISYAWVSGETYVRVPRKRGGDRVVIETANSQLHTAHGDFAIRALLGNTKVTLLDGDVTAITKRGGLLRNMGRRGNEVQVKTIRELNGNLVDSLVYRRRGNPEMAIAWTKAGRHYRDAPLREFVADMSRWYGIQVKDIHCIPESMRVSATVCYRAPLDEALAVVNKAGLRVHRTNGMYSFCDPDDGFRPALAQQDNGKGACQYCGQRH